MGCNCHLGVPLGTPDAPLAIYGVMKVAEGLERKQIFKLPVFSP